MENCIDFNLLAYIFVNLFFFRLGNVYLIKIYFDTTRRTKKKNQGTQFCIWDITRLRYAATCCTHIIL